MLKLCIEHRFYFEIVTNSKTSFLGFFCKLYLRIPSRKTFAQVVKDFLGLMFGTLTVKFILIVPKQIGMLVFFHLAEGHFWIYILKFIEIDFC